MRIISEITGATGTRILQTGRYKDIVRYGWGRRGGGVGGRLAWIERSPARTNPSSPDGSPMTWPIGPPQPGSSDITLLLMQEIPKIPYDILKPFDGPN